MPGDNSSLFFFFYFPIFIFLFVFRPCSLKDLLRKLTLDVLSLDAVELYESMSHSTLASKTGAEKCSLQYSSLLLQKGPSEHSSHCPLEAEALQTDWQAQGLLLAVNYQALIL